MDILFGANYIRIISPALGLVQCYSVNVKVGGTGCECIRHKRFLV